MKRFSTKIFFILFCPVFLLLTCNANQPAPWTGPILSQPRDQLTVEQLQRDSIFPLMDMSYFAKPEWATNAMHHFSGSLSFQDTEMLFPKARKSYSGEDTFPSFTVDFLAHNGELIPKQKEVIVTRFQSESFWDLVIGTGKVWQEQEDGEWSRASFPITLTDRYMGQTKNCVASFVYQSNSISNVCVQCSQETADLGDNQVGDIRVTLKTEYVPVSLPDSTQIIEQHKQFKARKLSVQPLSTIDLNQEVANYFDKSYYTNASTSQGAILMDDQLYVHPPKTRHGLYPYPDDMRHGLYSVTKSMTGALAMLYFAERYGEDIFNEQISEYVPALKDHPAWKGVTFSHTLNMATGTEGSEGAPHLLNILVLARTAEEAINNIANLGDYPEAPGEKFNYASTNFFVLSYALQNYVEAKEGEGIYYWDLVHENVLKPIGADYFSLRHTVESDGSKGLPLLAYGAYPTLDEAAKISLLFSKGGNYQGQQLLHKEKTREALGRTGWPGYRLKNDYRGTNYRHAFWSRSIRTKKCKVHVSYMLGYGANYVLFLPSDVIIFRFMDEYDLNIRDLVRGVEKLRSSCQ